ncbi:MAG: alpha/beta hydrolase [Flavobacteriales bacterium]
MTYGQQEKRIPLLLIHGFPLDRTMWRPQLEGLRDVARPIAPDLRGFGDSGDTPDIMNMGDYASDLHALLRTMGIQQAVICGLSMGGYIALAFLQKYPSMVQGLVLCHTKATDDPEETRKARLLTAKTVLESGSSKISVGLYDRMISEHTKQTRVDVTDHLKRMMDRQEPAAIAAASRGMAVRPDRTDMLASITVPTLIITSEQDQLIPASESTSMHEAIPGSTLVQIPDTGHLSNMENSDAFNEQLRLFLLSVGRRQHLQNA